METTTTPVPRFIVTDAAREKALEVLSLEASPGMALRLAVRSGGCSGFSYELCFDAAQDQTDAVLEFGDLRVVIDQASAPLLDGASLDFKNSLSEQGFKITNPNATRTCGCGQSFSS